MEKMCRKDLAKQHRKKNLILIPHSRIRNQAMNGYQLHSFSWENIRLVLNSVFIEPNQLLSYFYPQFLASFFSFSKKLELVSVVNKISFNFPRTSHNEIYILHKSTDCSYPRAFKIRLNVANIIDVHSNLSATFDG